MSSPVKNIAIIGASGNLGAPTVAALLSSKAKHNITVISRSDSTASFPSSVTLKRGSYTDTSFLHSALSGQDVLILIVGFPGFNAQGPLVEAAAKAGVKYVLPTEFGNDSENKKMLDAVPIIAMKADLQKKIQALGMKSISVITNPWVEFCLKYGVYGFDIAARKATLYTDSAAFNTTTIARVAAGVAAMLALPESELDKTFGNNFLRLSSFSVTQPDLFASLLRATGTKEADWTVSRAKVQDRIDAGHKMLADGDGAGHSELLFGNTFKAGVGGDYSDKTNNSMFVLPEEDLDEVVRAVVKSSAK